MGKKILLNKNWLLFLAINFFFISSILGQSYNTGDYRSKGSGLSNLLSTWEIYDSGAWRDAILADGIPGQNAGTYSVTIAAGHTVTIEHDITSALTGSVHIFGTLVLGDTSPRVITWNSSLFVIETTGKVQFIHQKTILKLPANAVIQVEELGDITGACSNN
ncbi:MAG: hypothetical protein OEL54_04315, partial [Flavobacteriaceae bacterium]|nr:hypothetical protein [Flavobacteriaceae bacterium]